MILLQFDKGNCSLTKRDAEIFLISLLPHHSLWPALGNAALGLALLSISYMYAFTPNPTAYPHSLGDEGALSRVEKSSRLYMPLPFGQMVLTGAQRRCEKEKVGPPRKQNLLETSFSTAAFQILLELRLFISLDQLMDRTDNKRHEISRQFPFRY